MRVAIYARKSTDQRVADEAKSVTRQVDNARAFAARRGWTVAEGHVYVDDGISGTEFEKRPAFMRMMNALKPRAPFDVLIVSEQKSIGREMSETSYAIKRLGQANVEIFEYVHGKSLTPRNPTEKLLSMVQGYSDEDHSVKSGERVTEAHTQKARKGYVVGGRVFGYRNVHKFSGQDASGNPIKSHTEREMNKAEAAVVRRIFELYDGGEGLKRIAMLLNAEGAVRPTPFVRKDATKVLPEAGWAPGTVRAILRRELYRGEVVWNKSKKRDESRQVKQQPRPESEWLRVKAEDLRIIDEPLWQRVQARRREAETLAARMAGGRLSGAPPKHATQNLFAGLATCSLCGGSLVVETNSRKKGAARVPEYVCYRHRTNGTCTNGFRMAVADLNEAVLQAIEEHALTPEAIEQVIRLTERDDVAERQVALERERAANAKKIARLVEVIAAGGDAASLVGKVRELEARQGALAAALAGLRPVPRLPAAVVEGRLAEWRRLLRGSTTQGRTVLQRILRGRITFRPWINRSSGEAEGYDFKAPTRFDKLFTGIAYESKPWTRDMARRLGPVGFEDTTPEDTMDADYGSLLERAFEQTSGGSRVNSSSQANGSPASGDPNCVEVLASPKGIEYFYTLVGTARKAA